MALPQITHVDNRILSLYYPGYASAYDEEEGENFRAPRTHNSLLELFVRIETRYDETDPPLSIEVGFGDYRNGLGANWAANERGGLTQEMISQCVKLRHCQDGDMMDICVVCQSNYEKGEMLATLACGHEFHGSCIRRCLRMKDSCPLCRRKAHRPRSS